MVPARALPQLPKTMKPVLVVDDDRFLLENLKRLLQREGYSVSTAASGEDALSHLSAQPCDLMILDLNLPGADGLSTCRRLRGEHTFPVIMLTARSGLADRVRGLDVGADDYLVKPFALPELTARMRALLRRDVLKRIPADRAFDLAELYTAMVAEGTMVGYEVTQRFYEIGTPESLDEARVYLDRNSKLE